MSEESIYERRGLIAVDRRATDRGTPDRRRGRKPLAAGDPSVEVSFRLPGSEYDRLFAAASEQRKTIAVLIREKLGVRIS